MPRFARGLLAATALVATAAPALAQTVTPRRVIAFGDSYVDSGNVFRISGQPLPTVYPTGRFSGGTNFVDTLERLFNAPQINFGIGGALAGPGNTGTYNISSPALPGFQFEIASFLAGGGGPFPTVTPRFTSTDLLAVSIGGNDARLYELSPGSTVAGAAPRAAIAVADATRGLDLLYNAGARNIAFLAGNVGDLPEVRGTPVAAIGTAYSQAFNAGIQTTLARYANGGALVHYLDLTLVGDRIRANPAAYGLVSAGACPVACVANPALQNQFLFYVDQVHLTSAGFAIVAEYFQRQIEAPGTLAAASDIGLSGAHGFARTMAGRIDLAARGDAERPVSVYLLATTDRHDRRSGETTLAYDFDNTGVAGGVEYNPGRGILAGLALGYGRPQARSGRADARTRADLFQVGVYGGVQVGGLDASGSVGYGMSDYRVRRAGVIDELRGETDGKSLSAEAELSYLIPAGPVRVGPLVSATYARATVDGYTEEGDAALTMNVGRQKLRSLVGHAGLEAKADFAGSGLNGNAYLNATLAKQFEGNGATVRFAGTASPTIVNAIRVGAEEEDVFGHFEAGASFALGGGVSAELQAFGTAEKPGGDGYGGFAGVRLRF